MKLSPSVGFASQILIGVATAYAASHFASKGRGDLFSAAVWGLSAFAIIQSAIRAYGDHSRSLTDRIIVAFYTAGVAIAAAMFLIGLFTGNILYVKPAVVVLFSVAVPFVVAVVVRNRKAIAFRAANRGDAIIRLLKSMGVVALVVILAVLIDGWMSSFMDEAFAALGTCVILGGLASIAEEQFAVLVVAHQDGEPKPLEREAA